MKMEILEILTNAKKHNSIYIYGIEGIFRRLKHKQGGRPATVNACNKLVKQGLIRKVDWYDGSFSFSAK